MKTAKKYFVLSALCGFGFVLALPIVVQMLQDMGAKPDTPLSTLISAMPILVQVSPVAVGAFVLLLLGIILLMTGIILLLISRVSSTSSSQPT